MRSTVHTTYDLEDCPNVTLHSNGEISIHATDYTNGAGFRITMSPAIATKVSEGLTAGAKGDKDYFTNGG